MKFIRNNLSDRDILTYFSDNQQSNYIRKHFMPFENQKFKNI